MPTSTKVLAVVVVAVACLECAYSTSAKAPATPTADAECGDIPDISDACPLVDGCPGTPPATTGDDGCPGPGGVPAGVDCADKERRLDAVASEIRRRPKLTALRIVTSVPGCADRVRDRLVGAGVAGASLEIVTEHDDIRCTQSARFEIAAWDGRRCGVAR